MCWQLEGQSDTQELEGVPVQLCEGDGDDVERVGRGDPRSHSTQTTVWCEGVGKGGRGEGHWGWGQNRLAPALRKGE